MLAKRSGFLAPTPTRHHPLISGIIRLAVALLPFALEHLERWAAHERHRRAQNSEGMASMSRPMTVSEARDILGVDPSMEGANSLPFKRGTQARDVADRNFTKFFALCQPKEDLNQDPEGKSDKQQSAAATAVRSDYIAGKLSGAYRLLCDDQWDRRRRR